MRLKLRSPGHPKFQQLVGAAFWVEIAKGLLPLEASAVIGVSLPVGQRWFHNAGGMPPFDLNFRSSGRYLPFAERAESGWIFRHTWRVEQFTVEVSEHALDDLRRRLEATRFSTPTSGPEGAAGISPNYLRTLVEHWLYRFNWRDLEARVNRFPQFLADVDGVTMHTVYRRAARDDAPTVVILHGWPYSFIEMLPLAEALPEMHVVIPSLPGYGFSRIPPTYLATTPAVAQTIHRLVREHLGISKYIVYGEDVGAPISQWLAANYPDEVIGIHDTHAAFPRRSDLLDPTQEEDDFFVWFDRQWDNAKGYGQVGTKRHDTISASLSDSPAGVASWIVEKFRDWSDCDGVVERRFSKDALLATATLYWLTDTLISSYRLHQEGAAGASAGVISVPATIAIQTHERRYPRSFADRCYSGLLKFSRMPRGGHFTAAEEPGLVADSLRELAALVLQARSADPRHRP